LNSLIKAVERLDLIFNMSHSFAVRAPQGVLLAGVLICANLAFAAPQRTIQQDANAPGETSSQAEQSSGESTGPTAAPSSAPSAVLLEDGHALSRTEPKDNNRQENNREENNRRDNNRRIYLRPPRPALTDFQKMVESSSGQVLPIYGRNLFDDVPTTFAPVDHVPVTSDYVVGPGDELLIRAWGQIDLDVHARVDRNGSIFVPKVGNLNVSGLKYEQVEAFLKSQIGRIYQNFDLNVTMGELRSIDVFVVGQARRPGRYTVSALSTLANAVFASGGPSATGSMRRIQLKRGTRVVTEFDLYDLLLNGDKTKDVLLQPEDVIYIPPVGPQVAIGGEVNVPAIYELKTETQMSEAIRLAGGLSTTAYGGKVLVEHIDARRARSVEEIKLDAGGLAHPLKDGDFVNITPVSPRFENSVTLRGNVARPGRYPWRTDMKISDLIPNREFLITRQYWTQQNAVVLQAATGNGHTPVTQTDVKRNAPEINWQYAVIQRMKKDDLSTQIIPFNLGKAILEHDEASNLALLPGDIVTIFSQGDLRVPQGKQTKLVRLEGEFVSAGVYRVEAGEKLRDLVERAGGLASSAYLYGAEFTRESARAEQQERLDMMIAQAEREIARNAAERAQSTKSSEEVAGVSLTLVSQRESLAKMRELKAQGRIVLNLHPDDHSLDSIPDIALEDGDRFYVPPRPAAVNVVGDVYNQGSFIQQPGKTVSAYLKNAGGPTRDADAGKAFVVRANGAVVSKETAPKFWSGGFDSMVMMPGDTLVVPEQVNKGSGFRSFRDWSQVLANFGLAAAAINILR
jgi:protein involved in polysaccharide export with SLBB domain